MSSKENTENIFKNQFESFKQTPPSSVWKKIERKMIFKRFLKYKPLSLNLWNIIGITAIITSTILITQNTTHKITKNFLTEKTIKNVITDNNIRNKSIVITEDKKETAEKTNTEKKITQINNAFNNKSENQISDKNEIEVISDNLLKENYTNSELKSNNEGKINVKLAEPHSEFSVSTKSACEPAAITFLNESENCDSFHWDFGNGKTSSQKNPTFVFNTAGTYTVTLSVTSGSVSDFTSKKITIYPKPNADFEIGNKNKNLFNNDKIIFLNNSSGYSKCIWNFGDNNTSTYTNPEHTYENAGNYKVSLISISDKRCADTAYISNVPIQDLKYKISFPTAFSPDKSGQNNGYWKNSSYTNTIFHPVVNTEVSKYRLRIFNKYGTLIFESTDINIGWNGFYKNSPASSEVYVWECSGKFEDGKLFKKTGNLTLLYLRNQ